MKPLKKLQLLFNTKNSEAIKYEIIRMWRNAYSLVKVAQILNVPYSFLLELLDPDGGIGIFELRKRLGIERPVSPDVAKHLMEVKTLYDKYLTLQKVGDELNVTRERVRQLLEKGGKYGLFVYERHKVHNIEKLVTSYSRDRIIAAIRETFNTNELCEKLNIDNIDLKLLIKHFNIDYGEYKRQQRIGKCLQGYQQIVDCLGHHPSTTELSSRMSWALTWRKINRYWGNIHKFRIEYGIERPKHRMHPNTLAAFSKTVEARSREAKERKMESKQQIIQLLQTADKLSINEISHTIRRGYLTVCKYVKELASEGKIKCVGSGNKVKYLLCK